MAQCLPTPGSGSLSKSKGITLEANAAEIISGGLAKEILWLPDKVGDGKMGLRPEDFLCLILPQVLLSAFSFHLSETAKVKCVPFLLGLS